jgi:hypothetical protein
MTLDLPLLTAVQRLAGRPGGMKVQGHTRHHRRGLTVTFLVPAGVVMNRGIDAVTIVVPALSGSNSNPPALFRGVRDDAAAMVAVWS